MHPKNVELLLRRTAAFVVAIMLAAAGWAECAGWQASPEARMACCSGSDCPMHGSTEPRTGSERVVTQAQADSCCAASGTNDSTPSAVAFSLSLSAALMPSTPSTLAPILARPASFAAWRTHVPFTVSEVAKHVLLSVFLI